MHGVGIGKGSHDELNSHSCSSNIFFEVTIVFDVIECEEDVDVVAAEAEAFRIRFWES